jgi:hypothetical protein
MCLLHSVQSTAYILHTRSTKINDHPAVRCATRWNLNRVQPRRCKQCKLLWPGWQVSVSSRVEDFWLLDPKWVMGGNSRRTARAFFALRRVRLLSAPVLPIPTTDSVPFFARLIALMYYDTQGEPLPLTMAPLKPKIDKRKQGRVKKFLQEPVRKVVHKQRVSGWKVRIRCVCGLGLKSQSMCTLCPTRPLLDHSMQPFSVLVVVGLSPQGWIPSRPGVLSSEVGRPVDPRRTDRGRLLSGTTWTDIRCYAPTDSMNRK